MPSADYILTAPCSEIAGQVMAPAVYPQTWVAPVGRPEFALGIFGVALNVVLLCLAARFICRAVRFLWSWRECEIMKGICTVAVCGMMIVGMTKGVMSVNFPRTDPEVAYLVDAGSYVTNNAVHVDFTTFLIPASAQIELAYWPLASSNEEDIVVLFSEPLSAWPRPLDFDFADAISNRWYCYTTWTPGPVVHTNGVWQQDWMMGVSNRTVIVPVRTTVIEDGRCVMPPLPR